MQKTKTIRIEAELYKKFRMVALQQNKTVKALLEELMATWMKTQK